MKFSHPISIAARKHGFDVTSAVYDHEIGWEIGIKCASSNRSQVIFAWRAEDAIKQIAQTRTEWAQHVRQYVDAEKAKLYGPDFNPSRFDHKTAMPADLKAPRRMKCPKCSGTGQHILHAMTVQRCLHCEGRGRVIAPKN